jgi:transcriptional regulator with XRE-family HTH domain
MSTLKDRINWAFDTLHQRRKKNDGGTFTREDLARACKVKPSSVSDWFSGNTKSLKAEPSIRAAIFLDVLPLWLICGEGQRTQTAGMNSVLVAEEPKVVYEIGSMEKTNQWPFERVEEARYRRLSDADQAYVQGEFSGAIRLCESQANRTDEAAPRSSSSRP